jgi:hypothetical protein
LGSLNSPDNFIELADEPNLATSDRMDPVTSPSTREVISAKTCPIEYDLTAIADGTLRLGDRSHPLCTPDTRPTKLQALGFVRE